MSKHSYTHFWDGMDGDGWYEHYATEKEAMKAHRKAVKNRKTQESRVKFYQIEHDSGKIIAKWRRGHPMPQPEEGDHK